MNKILEIPTLFGHRLELYIVLLIVVVSVFFFWKRLFAKYRRRDKSITLIVWGATIILTPFLCLGVVWLLTYQPSRSFDKTIWMQHKESRYRMSTDLINKNILLGKDTNGVMGLLREPNSKPSSKMAINRWVYSLGESNVMFKPVYHNLIIRFTDGKVVANSQFEIGKY
jgi:amino acid transporter